MSASMTSAHEAMGDDSIKVSETVPAAAATIKQSGVVQNYAMPAWSMAKRRYNQSPMVLKISVLSFAALSAVPIGCFMGFMGLITVGCMIVSGIVFTAVEGGFAMLGIVWSPGDKRDIQRNVERGMDKAQQATTSFGQ
ncbi:hypothetical protein BG011_003670 [Mortierella polycephala]|uniref:Uncharacterized protein n=1 Tax=Mortierella polycephala TaxID=41804 RepID=A0A9P6Q2A3_9FUNG|nr:hypothetical protein BG011_003670 [Mortierella polycephala]